MCLRTCGIARKDAQSLSGCEKSKTRQVLLQSAHTNHRQETTALRNIFCHQEFERLGDAVNGMRRRQPKAAGKFLVSDRPCGLSLIEQNLTQSVLQHATPILRASAVRIG